MQRVYFRTGTSGSVGYICTSDGRIDFSELAELFKLDPKSILLNGILFRKEGLKSESKWEDIEKLFKEDGICVGTKDDPVVVTAIYEAAVPAVSTGKPPLNKSKPSLQASGALRQVLEEKCPDAIGIVEGDDISKLVAAGFFTTAAFASATEKDLFGILPGRPALVRLLLKAFVQPADGANRISLSTRTKCEFDFEVMNTWKPGDPLNTAEIAEALKDYGGFPSLYYVRLEETMVFRKCLDLLIEQPSTDRLRVVLLGSPGVGKSVFLVLFAFYLAHVQSRSVLILRKVKGGFPKQIFALVHVCREGYSGATFNELSDFRGIRDQPGHSLMFFDGFTQSDVNSIHNPLGSFNLLATSSQYNLKSDDFATRCILLPAWLPEDLRAISAIIYREHFEEHFEEAYSYSGGSLREFLSTEKERFNVFENAISRISDPGNLLTIHGAGTMEQVDTIRKLFVKDRTEAEDYDTRAQWVPTVDSRMAVLHLLDRLSEENFGKMLKIGKGVGGGFYGNAFEWYIHKKASSPGGLSIEAQGYGSDILLVFDVPGKAAVCKGEKIEECLKGVKDWLTPETKYWYPQMSNFPNIDSIAVCNASIGGVVEEYLVYIQITIAERHDLNHAKLNTLDKTFEAQYGNRAYVALLPEDAPKEAFSLIGDVKTVQIPCYVGTLCSGGRKKKRNSQ